MLDHAVITAPFDGVVARKFADVGDLAAGVLGDGHQPVGLPQREECLDAPEEPRSRVREDQARVSLGGRIMECDDGLYRSDEREVRVPRREEKDVERKPGHGACHPVQVGWTPGPGGRSRLPVAVR